MRKTNLLNIAMILSVAFLAACQGRPDGLASELQENDLITLTNEDGEKEHPTVDKFLKKNSAPEWLTKNFKETWEAGLKVCGETAADFPFAKGEVTDQSKILVQWSKVKEVSEGMMAKCQMVIDYDVLGKLEAKAVDCSCKILN